MPLPNPEPGLVISYSYLWRYEHEAGQEEGRKTRPCVIILSVEKQGQDTVVTVAPITHTPPTENADAVEIPTKVKKHLNLDDERSWVVLGEVNQFAWPGYDLQSVQGHKGRYDYGFLPPRLFEDIKENFLKLIMKRRAFVTPRN